MGDSKTVKMEVEKMSAGKGKPKEVRTITIEGVEWRVLPEQPPQNWQIDKYLLNDTIGLPDSEQGGTLLAMFDKEKNTLIIKKAQMEYQVEVSFPK
jgi:hypothetical protein